MGNCKKEVVAVVAVMSLMGHLENCCRWLLLAVTALSSSDESIFDDYGVSSGYMGGGLYGESQEYWRRQNWERMVEPLLASADYPIY